MHATCRGCVGSQGCLSQALLQFVYVIDNEWFLRPQKHFFRRTCHSELEVLSSLQPPHIKQIHMFAGFQPFSFDERDYYR